MKQQLINKIIDLEHGKKFLLSDNASLIKGKGSVHTVVSHRTIDEIIAMGETWSVSVSINKVYPFICRFVEP